MTANMEMNWETPVREVLDKLGVKAPRDAYLVRHGGVVAAIGTPDAPGDASVVLVRRDEYDALVRIAEDAEDRAAIDRGRRGESTYLPGEMVARILAGESAWRVWREHRGLTLEQLAAKAAEHGATIGKAQLSHIETGRSKPSLDTAIAVAKALGIAVEDLLG